MDKKTKKLFYLEYSLLFFLIAGLIVFYYYSQGKCMIDSYGDGFRQHFRSLVYYSNCLKEMFGNFLNGSFGIPQWDFAISEGSDILGAFPYYCVGDIFTFFCFLCPEKYLYLYYDAITILRMYCSGIAFAALCFYRHKDNVHSIVTGCLMYAFSTFAFTSMSGHVFFISAAVYLPIIILGVEKIINHDKPYLLVLGVMLSALSNFYFFYMNVLTTIIFVVVRMLFVNEEYIDRLKTLFRITMYSLLGLCMGMVVFLPMLIMMLNNGRLETKVTYDAIYSFEEYVRLFKSMTFDGAYFGGFSVLWPIGFSVLLTKKKNITLISLLLLMIMFVGIPNLSSLYNAMSYPTERWCYATALLVSYIVVDSLDNLDEINNCFYLNVAIVIIYYALCIVLDHESWRIHALFMAMSLCLLVFIKFMKIETLNRLALLSSIVVFMLIKAFYTYSPGYINYARVGQDIDGIENRLLGEYVVFDSVEDNSFFRYSGKSLMENASIHGGYSSTQYYWSVVNGYVTEFRKQLGYSDRSLHHIANYGERFSQNMLSSVKYYINASDNYLPYGYEYLDNIYGFDVYETEYSLPLLYAYDNYMLIDEWNTYNPAAKNEILVQSAIIDKEITSLNKYPIKLDNKELTYKRTLSNDINVTQDQIDVSGENAFIYLDVDNKDSGEYYVMVEDLYSNKLAAYITIKYKNIEKNFVFKGSDNQHYTDRHNYIVNLGYLDGINGRISIDFSDGGSYTYDSIKVICQPLDNQIKYIEKLKDINIKNLVVKKNNVQASVDLDSDKLVCFSIPYSKGWKAYVDGKETQLLNCNIQYMAIELSKGSHTIELKYSTPYLKTGAIISFAAYLVFTFLLLRDRRDNVKMIK